MDQHLHIITLGVSDLAASIKFYKDILGWKLSPASSEGIAFFMAGGVVLALFPYNSLAEDANVPATAKTRGFSGFTLAFNVSSEAEVDRIIAGLESKKVTITKRPQKMFWGGYSSYFSDPDGYLWEVAYNPSFPFDDRGNLKI